MWVYASFFFFFQAEDGIRDSSVTGVQTCALPICLCLVPQPRPRIAFAEYLGWVAYNNGDYKDAAHWLELSKGNTGPGLWLRAKLQRRSGKLPDAANSMAQAEEWLKNSPAYTPPGEADAAWTEYDFFPEGHDWGLEHSAHRNVGLHL